MLLTMVPLVLAWRWADSFGDFLLVGLLLGVAGASFAVALPLASRWYPAKHQGLVMGIAGAGNSGTALATFFAPRLAEVWGWQVVFGFALIPVGVVMIIFYLFAKDSSNRPAPKSLRDYSAILNVLDTWRFCLLYAVTFGGFVGFASFLTIFFHDQFGVSKIEAGTLATLGVVAGSFLRPVGGWLADRFGGIPVLGSLNIGIALSMLGVSLLLPFTWTALFMFVGMGCLGMGNGAVFQLVPQRFSKEIGVITGVVGAAGGIGGFILPNLLGSLKELSGTYAIGFILFALAACSAAFLLRRRSFAPQPEVLKFEA
jgi:NNP family nitrate/nitrite transporter-like MFS transporter